jgi:hypothetical protein
MLVEERSERHPDRVAAVVARAIGLREEAPTTVVEREVRIRLHLYVAAVVALRVRDEGDQRNLLRVSWLGRLAVSPSAKTAALRSRLYRGRRWRNL